MERHLDNLEGRNSSHPSTLPMVQSNDNVDYPTMVDEATAIRMIEEEREMVRTWEGYFRAQRHCFCVLFFFSLFWRGGVGVAD